MTYIILMSSKGGSGKSVLCKQFSRELYRLGYSVRAADYDPQQHFAQFAEVNNSMFTESDTADYVLVDTQGAHTQTNIDIIESMKTEKALFVIPFRPTEDDYKEALRMRDRLKENGILDKAVFVANGCYREHDKDVKKYQALLADTVNISSSIFVQRKAYAKDPDSKVISEVSRFLNEIVI